MLRHLLMFLELVLFAYQKRFRTVKNKVPNISLGPLFSKDVSARLVLQRVGRSGHAASAVGEDGASVRVRGHDGAYLRRQPKSVKSMVGVHERKQKPLARVFFI